MTKSFMVFPTGTTGAGLLLLRLSLAGALVSCLQLAGADALKAGIIALALALVAGFGARPVAAIAALLAGGVAWNIGGLLGLFVALHGIGALALSLLGAGGYSVDARIFGRRIIDLD